ncbi:ferric-dicitrate binding protein FerR (iron transport regulator) [Filimonas zeae]|uniref:Iron dicitrate transporter FecR n=1 Tax=Filimonas zeae TaxID=1737353 RepID=A0A917IX18_9BACT|nr:FecR domain-containing protein [Filimonas zeae]MDR6339308.1 ferric-dicitrate binding protein FerR (iron transport regulator) [Filimonas zeae]GGH64188.1 iron dicitrate transporter FecR [Filimonas zeae]
MQQPNSQEYYQELSRKRLEGTLTPEEAEALAAWLNQDDEQPLEVSAAFAESYASHEERLFRKIAAQTIRPRPVYRRLAVAVSAAAVLLLMATGICYFYFNTTPAKQQMAGVKNDRLPGTNKATLILANGQEILLDSAADGALADESGVRVIKLAGGRVAYQADGQPGTVAFNTLVTPRGGRFRVQLPDGTEVWLNAASRLRYPVSFSGGGRVVELEGQAWFEVAGNARQPFTVKTGGAEVHVLGTHFDVMAYADEKAIRTTLVEGSVEVTEGNKVRRLEPRQQAVIDRGQHSIAVQTVNVDHVLAWKEGLFVFNDVDLHTILREIGRWYDIEIVNEAGVTAELYGGSISRSRNLKDVLNLLGAYGSPHFTINGQKLVVSP